MENESAKEIISPLGDHEDVPHDSMTLFLSTEINTDFHSLRELIMGCGTIVEGINITETFAFQLIEELFRYLYSQARSSSAIQADEPVAAPSKAVSKALHCLLLDPVLYYQICDTLLSFAGFSCIEHPVRLLPHNPLCTDDEIQCNVFYKPSLSDCNNRLSTKTVGQSSWAAMRDITNTFSAKSTNTNATLGLKYEDSIKSTNTGGFIEQY